MARVSILIPNYNHAKHLHQSLGGACGQTRPADEVLVADDGSSDDSVAVIQDFAARYPQLRLLQNDRNRGMQYTINRLLEESTGDYIVCAAADDELYPAFLEQHMARLERYPQAGLSVSEFMTTTPQNVVVNRSREMPMSFGLQDLPDFLTADALKDVFKDRYVWMSSNAIVCRRDAIVKVGGFIKEQEWHSDWFTYYAVAMRHGVCPIPQGLGMIRESPGGYSDAGMRDFPRQRKVLLAIIDSACRSPNADLRAIYRRSPAILSVFGGQLAKVLVSKPQYWDMAIPYWLFLVRRFKRNSNRTWGGVVRHVVKRALV
jgi:glycosyltransferase involved in cell wall biosynthesis